MAALIAGGSFDDIDLSALTCERFGYRNRWVLEELHI